MTANGELLCQRYDALKGERGTFESHWQEISEYIFPRRADFNVQHAQGDKRQTKIFDGTGTQALELLAAGLHGMATNPASRWFSVKMSTEKLNDIDAIREYLATIEDEMFSEMHAPGTSITTHLHELYMDYAAFGTGVMFIGKTKKDRLLFQTRFLGECLIDENNEGVVDTVLRKFKMSVRQCVQNFGDKVSRETKDKYTSGKLNEQVEIIHAVYPREEADLTKKDTLNMPFASCYIELKDKHVLNEGGFEEFPYAVPRWYKVAGEVYGRSPAMTALPDVKMLQEMMKNTLKAAQKIVDPPLMVPDEGMIGPVRTVPGGLNFFRGDYEIKPLVTGGNVPLALEMMQDVRNRILTTFFVDQLQMSGDADMTATEVMQRTEERMRLLGPILGRMESELLGPIITRVFGILSRLNKFPEQPEELDDQDFVVEYVSPIAIAQRAQKVDRVVGALTIAGQVAGSVPPGHPMFARFNDERFLPWLFEEMNADPELILDDSEMESKEQQTQMMNAAGPAAMAADAFAKTGQGAKAFAEAQAVGSA
jgi:hypothetical protein